MNDNTRKHELDTRNDRGYVLIGFAEGNNLKTINTLFDNKASRKLTWKIPNGETTNEIYFMVTNN